MSLRVGEEHKDSALLGRYDLVKETGGAYGAGFSKPSAQQRTLSLTVTRTVVLSCPSRCASRSLAQKHLVRT